MVNPSALISVSAAGTSFPIACIVSPSTAMSACSTPDSVTTAPPRMTRSAGIEGLHFVEERESGCECGGHVFLTDRFVRMVTDPARATKKQHRDGHLAGDDHGVVSGAAIHSMRR